MQTLTYGLPVPHYPTGAPFLTRKEPELIQSGLSLEIVNSHYSLTFAESESDVRQAQRLRWQVFTQEFGATARCFQGGFDHDEFDTVCDHLIVKEIGSQQVVGTYRILWPEHAERLGRYYSQSGFYMTRLKRQLPNLVELGRSCVHPDHRNGVVIMLLWTGIARAMKHRNMRYLIGSASMCLQDGGHQAAALWDRLMQSSLVDPVLESFPRNPLPLNRIERAVRVDEPPLVKGYLRIGAQVCGEPNWDVEFNSADFLMLLDIQNMNPRYARHLGC